MFLDITLYVLINDNRMLMTLQFPNESRANVLYWQINVTIKEYIIWIRKLIQWINHFFAGSDYFFILEEGTECMYKYKLWRLVKIQWGLLIVV